MECDNMKRLLRKTAEFIDAIEISGNYTEIYKNPTGREFDAIKEYCSCILTPKWRYICLEK